MLDAVPTRSFPTLLKLRLFPLKMSLIPLFFVPLKDSNLIFMTVLLRLFDRLILEKD